MALRAPQLDPKYVLADLEHTGALLTGDHFVYVSSRHGSAYVNKNALYPHTQIVERFCAEMAHRCLDLDVEIVVGAATGGIILSHCVARNLSTSRQEVLCAYAEPESVVLYLKRGYDTLVGGKNVLIVEDILNTGSTAQKLMDAVRRAHGNVVGVAAICNRGNVTAEDIDAEGVPFFALADLQLESWREEECPLCAASIPINATVGHGRAYLTRTKAQT